MTIFIFFSLALLILAALVIEALIAWNEAWAKPALAVYGTAGMWYPGNMLYAGIDHFKELFPDAIIQAALLQFCGFIICLRLFIPLACRLLAKKSEISGDRAEAQSFEQQIIPLFWMVMLIWVLLFTAGAIRLEGNILPVIWPPLAREKVSLFIHTGIGGRTGFLAASAQYSYQLTCAFFGVAFILGRGGIRTFAFIMICLTWPYYLFDRMRNVQLAISMPALICYLLLGRSRPLVKGIAGVSFFAVLYIWFLLVGMYRSDYDMSRFLSVPKNSARTLLVTRHFGLDMMEELCYINQFIEKGTYKINHGERYLADALNFVPRAIWPNKPLVGFDYAIARGFANPGAGYREVGVTATIATGMIGQGVTNFGCYFGVAAAAFLMSLWVGLLARLWTQRRMIGKVFLFILGMGLTFNLGRDITLLVLWPFVFASIGVWILSTTAARPVYRNSAGPLSGRR